MDVAKTPEREATGSMTGTFHLLAVSEGGSRAGERDEGDLLIATKHILNDAVSRSAPGAALHLQASAGHHFGGNALESLVGILSCGETEGGELFM